MNDEEYRKLNPTQFVRGKLIKSLQLFDEIPEMVGELTRIEFIFSGLSSNEKDAILKELGVEHSSPLGVTSLIDYIPQHAYGENADPRFAGKLPEKEALKDSTNATIEEVFKDKISRGNSQKIELEWNSEQERGKINVTLPNDEVTDSNKIIPETERQILEELDLDPEEFALTGVSRISSGKWELFNGEMRQSRRWSVAVVPRSTLPRVEDYEELIKNILTVKVEKPTPYAKKGDGSVFVLHMADLQIGKGEKGGTAGIIERVKNTLQTFRTMVEEIQPDSILVTFTGDCIEGATSQRGKVAGGWDMGAAEQLQELGKVYAAVAQVLAGTAPDVHIAVVNGNHDEATRQLSQLPGANGYATNIAETVANTTKIFGNDDVKAIHWHTPLREKNTMVININGCIFTLVHGHQFRQKAKAEEWWKNQIFAHPEEGYSHFLLHGHFHQPGVVYSGERVIICAPTFEGDSAWFDEIKGTAPDGYKGGYVFLARNNKMTGAIGGVI